MLNYYLPGSSSWELGLVLLGSMTVTVLLLMLCACLKRKRGTIVSDSHKNGNMFGSSRTNGAEAEFDDESLRGARATSHRRLPDIPDPLNGLEDPLVRHSSVRSSQDTSSELYAQVEIGAISNSFPVNSNATLDHSEAVRNGAATFNPQTSNDSETHPYDKVKTNNHGYSKIKKKSENPYAKVKRSDTMESEPAEADENETDTDNYDVVYTLHHADETKKATDSSPKPGSSSSSSTNADNFASLAPPPLPLPLRGSHSSLASGGVIGPDVPRPPPRGRRSIVALSSYSSSSSSSLMAAQVHRPNSMVLVNDHPDAVANGDDLIDGAIAPNEEGHGHPPHEANGAATAQVHFSGDSQTSQDSKGYSSISVREPLANLKAQNPRPGAVQVGRQRMNSASHRHQNQQQQRQQQRPPESSDPHYATVSDAEDSDEMYAAIAELQPIYDMGSGGAGGSDTYAKIADHRSDLPAAAEATSPIASASGISSVVDPIYASTTAPVHSTSISPNPVENDIPSPSPLPPTPPSVVSLKQLSSASGSSRLHASTLSIASTASGVGSPKPEKRQANSPLPPPPIHQQQAEAEGFSRKSMNVEEMYAKVMKKKGMTLHPWQVQQQLLYSSEAATSSNAQTQLHRGSVDLGFLSIRDEEPRESSSLIHVSSRRSSVDTSPPQRVGHDVNDSIFIVETSSGQDDVVVEEEEEDDDDEYDLRYEVLPTPRPEINRLGAGRTISESSSPGYERIQLKSEDSFNDPRYERIQPKRSSDIVEPNYEIVGFQGAVNRESNEPGYEEVELPPTAKFDRSDPNYESLHYAVNHQHSVSVRPRSDPPYATVGHADDGADSTEENEENHEETTAELVNNNTAIGQPVYAQVVKPKRTNLQSASVFVEDTTPAGAPATSGVEITHSPDFSVSSSKNTTIIRITDSRPAYRFFTEDAESFGVPEQV